ncbi:hypothetical protein [Pseudomonas fluvialis]|uniref:hypothetical protein n=1 Tax=Pseudomonas fluvialis TaxID=1793966 RepID=UPI0035AF6E29
MSGQTQPETALQALAEKLRTDAIAIFGEGLADRDIIEWFYAALLAAPAQPAAQQHPDGEAVDRFAVAMKAKLAKSREKGRHGWQMGSAAYLSSLLYHHMYKGDPLDVANLAMMLHQNGQAIELPQEARRDQGFNKSSEVQRLRETLEFYARGDHLLLADPDAWDTCSGEAENWLHDDEGTASVEDGSLAKAALAASTGQEVKP